MTWRVERRHGDQVWTWQAPSREHALDAFAYFQQFLMRGTLHVFDGERVHLWCKAADVRAIARWPVCEIHVLTDEEDPDGRAHEVWLDTEIGERDGICLAYSQTRDAAIAEARDTLTSALAALDGK